MGGGAAAVPEKKRRADVKRFINFSIPQKFDFSFFMIILIFLAFGLVMLFSATYAMKYNGDSFYFIKRQLIFAAAGFAAMILISFIDYHFYAQKFIIKTATVVSMGLMLASDRNYLFLALALSLSLLFIFYVYLYKLQHNISHLRNFAEMAEKNQDIRNADIRFSNDELGEISRNIVNLYAKLQNSEDDKTRLKRQLTQNIAHELKTPVSSIQGYLETIIDNPDLDETTRNDFLERCHAQSERLGNLISDITLLSKIDDAFTSFSTEEIDVEAMLQNIRKATELDMEAKKMKFLILIAPGTTVHGSQQLIYSIFRNLTDNAIAYAGEGTTITVQCLKEEKNKLWFSFSDNGAGVPPEHLTHLFERFYRVDKGRSRKLGGTGLGLAIVKNAVLLHGGTINVQIAHTGGLDFHFSLNK